MAIALDASLGSVGPTNSAVTSISITTGAAAASGSHIFVAVYTWDDPDHPISVTDTDGNAYLKIGDGPRLGDTDTVCSLFAAYAPSGLTSGDSITITFSGSIAFHAACAISFTGLPAKSPLAFVDGFNCAGAVGGATWNSGNITTTVANALIIRAVSSENDVTAHAWDAGTEAYDLSNANGSLSLNYQIVSSTGTYSSSGTFTATPSARNALVVAFADTAFDTPYVSGFGVKADGAGDVVPALPVGWAADDIFLLFCESANETVAAPSGWTAVADSPQGTGTGGGTSATRLTVFWRRAVGGDTAPTVVDPSNHCVAQILGFRGCITSGDPWDVTSGGTASTSTSVAITGDTTTVNNCLVIAAVARMTDNVKDSVHTWANSDLTSVLEIADAGTAAGNGGGFGVAMGRKLSSGSYGNTTATLIATSVQGFMTIALKPPTVGGATEDPFPYVSGGYYPSEG